jgi:hypothetical protein
VLLLLVLWGLLAAPVVVPLVLGFGGWMRRYPLRAQLGGDAALAGALLLATWLMMRFADRRPFAALGLSPRRAPRDLPIGVVLGIAWLGASLGLAWLAGCLSAQPGARLSAGVLAGAAASVALNVLTQQLMLCGYVLQTLRARVGLPAALLLSALLFTLVHAGAYHHSWLPAVNVFAAGLLFTLAWHVSGGLWLPIGLHFTWNYLLGPVLGLAVSGSMALGRGWQVLVVRGPAPLSGGAFGLEGGLPVTLTTVIGMAALAWRARLLRPHAPPR